jgi:nitrogen fixation/metabolism regulation signal transduction histidine kinase
MRRLYYINPKIQFPFIRFMTGLLSLELVVAGFVYIVTEHFCHNATDDLAIYLHYGSLILLIAVFSSINLYFAARLSHRISGPLVQVLRALERARSGDYSCRVKIRGGDYLHELSEAVNILLEGLDDPAESEGTESRDDESKRQEFLSRTS